MRFKDYIINENTLSQELKTWDKESVSWIKDNVNSVIKSFYESRPTNHLGNAPEQFINKLTKWFTWRIIVNWTYFTKSERSREESQQALIGSVKMSQRTHSMGQLSGFVRDTLENRKDYLAAHYTDRELLSKLNDTDFATAELQDEDLKWHNALRAKAEKTKRRGSKGRDLGISVGNYNWVSLDRASCEVEAKAGGHCGNSGAMQGDNILSLRNKNNDVFLTFVINSGTLKEAKGRFNKPPEPEFYPAIVALLKHDMVKRFFPQGYTNEEQGLGDFKLSDLSDKDRLSIIKNKKPPFDLVGHDSRSNIREQISIINNHQGERGELVISKTLRRYEFFKSHAADTGNSFELKQLDTAIHATVQEWVKDGMWAVGHPQQQRDPKTGWHHAVPLPQGVPQIDMDDWRASSKQNDLLNMSVSEKLNLIIGAHLLKGRPDWPSQGKIWELFTNSLRRHASWVLEDY